MSARYDIQNARKDTEIWNKPDPATYQKIAFLLGHCVLSPGARIADMGCGWGEGSYHLARMNPQVQVVGVDINPARIRAAQRRYDAPANLTYQLGNVERADLLDGPFDAFLNSSVMHHVYSYNLYDEARVRAALENQYRALKTDGLLVVRDFLAWPKDAFVYLSLQTQGEGRSLDACSEARMLRLYARAARLLLPAKERGFFLQDCGADGKGWRRFYLPAYWAAEFVLRKDYRKTFKSEAQECYSFWDQSHWEAAARDLGARVLYSGPYSNPWIVENRLNGRVRLTDERGGALDFPPTNYVMILQKTQAGGALHLSERAAVKAAKPYLDVRGYRSGQGGPYVETASRPGFVHDYLPFMRAGERLTVWAKCGYPRPLLNAAPRGSFNLDGKNWSGYVIEPLAVANMGALETGRAALAAKMGAAAQALGDLTPALTYYPSPSLTEERVSSFFAPCAAQGAALAPVRVAGSVSGYSDSGDVRPYDAQNLLRAAHVGILPEARLELNIYALLRAQGLAPEAWMDGAPPAPPQGDFEAQDLDLLLKGAARQVFHPVRATGRLLRRERSIFEERAAQASLARGEHEAIYPLTGSANSGIVFPLARDRQGALCLGVLQTDAPGLQKDEGDSRFVTVPQLRFPFAVRSLREAATFLSREMGGAALRPLGEGYYASLGMMRERCYPFWAALTPEASPWPLTYIPLDTLFARVESLRDASLMLGVFRAAHAFDLWDKGLAQIKKLRYG